MMKFKLKVVPNSSKEIIENHKDFIKVKVSAVPEKNKANQRIIELLAEYFEVPKSKVRIIGGAFSKTKFVEIQKG